MNSWLRHHHSGRVEIGSKQHRYRTGSSLPGASRCTPETRIRTLREQPLGSNPWESCLNDGRGCLGRPAITGNEVLVTMMLDVGAVVGLRSNSVSKTGIRAALERLRGRVTVFAQQLPSRSWLPARERTAPPSGLLRQRKSDRV